MLTRSRSWKPLAAILFFSGLLGCHHAGARKTGSGQHPQGIVTAESLFEVGLLHAQRGDSLRAEQYLSAARSRGYDEAASTYWLVRVCLAGGRYHSALSHAADYLRDHPGQWGLRLVVATIHEALGELDRAREELERVVERMPHEPLGHYRLAMLYQRLRPPVSSSALLHLETYLQLAPHGEHAEEVRDALQRAKSVRVENAQVLSFPHDRIMRLP